jgi:uncharacterized iron-regulated protein
MLWRLLTLALFVSIDLFAQRSLHLSIGDPARKDKEAKLVLDAVTATASGELLTPREAVARMEGTPLIFIGESHTSMDFHKAQLRIIQELQSRGKRVFIGLEMYPRTEQKSLDDWCGGLLTETGFIELSRWYKNWGYHWNYYRDIFLFARDKKLRMFALNAPREVVSAVTRKGLENLSPEERSEIAPEIDTSSEEYFTLFKAFFADETGMHARMSDSQARAMFASQCTWDATMGYNAVRALKDFGDENTVMVVLIGSGHVAYGLGIHRQSSHWFAGKMASIVPIEVADSKDAPIAAVQASYADYIWGMPPEKDPVYPDLGIATVEAAPGDARRKVISVGKDSPAGIAGVQTGDILVSLDGRILKDREDLNRLISEKRWGDSVELVVDRKAKPNDGQQPSAGSASASPSEAAGGTQETVTIYLRRRYPATKASAP